MLYIVITASVVIDGEDPHARYNNNPQIFS